MDKPHCLKRWETLACMAAGTFILTMLAACSLRLDPAVCNFDTINRPVMTSPAWDDVTSTTPTFSWTYLDAECPAFSFDVIVGTDELGVAAHTGSIHSVSGTSLTWPEPLLPGTTYYWHVLPIVNTTDGDIRGIGGEAIMPFNTGPECSLADERSIPTLLSPVDGEIIRRLDGFGFYWDDPSACIPANYELEISETDDFSASYLFVGERRTSLGVYSDDYFAYQDCHRYYWRVRSTLEAVYGPYSDVWYFTINAGTIICPLNLGQITPPAVIIYPPIASPRVDVNCRSGPTLDFPLLSVLPAGNEYEIQARNTLGDSWMVLDPAIHATCWVYGDLVEVVGDTSLVGIIDPDPPGSLVQEPTSLFNCAQYNTNQPACSAEPACKWDPNNSPNSPCVNK